MINELKVINEQVVLGKVFRVYGDLENPLFLAKDVAEWIDYAYKDKKKGTRNVNMMLNTVDDDEKLVARLFTSGQNREMWFLTEDGIYEVLMQSRKPIAKQFKKKVKEILKGLRKGELQIVDKKQQLQLAILNGDEMTRVLALKEYEDVLTAPLLDEIDKIGAEKQQVEQELDMIVTSSTTIEDSKELIKLHIQKIASIEYYGNFSKCWSDFYKHLNHKLGINIKARKKKDNSWLNTLNEYELREAELMVKSWAKELDIDVRTSLNPRRGFGKVINFRN